MKEQELITLFAVTTREPVMYKSSVDKNLSCADGELKLDLRNRVVLAKAHDVHKRLPLIIPLENVTSMVEFTDEIKTKLAAKKAADTKPAQVTTFEKPNNADRVKFVKDEFGKIVEQRG